MFRFRRKISRSALVISCILISTLFIIQFRILFHKFVIPARTSMFSEVQSEFSEDTKNNSPSSTSNIIKQTRQILDLPSSEDPTFVDAKPFLQSTPDNDSTLYVEPIQFIRDIKNPCFALTEDLINVGNINVSYAAEKRYSIRCLPYAYIAGFTKCGTTDIFRKLYLHRLVRGAMINRSNVSRKWADRVDSKEAHFWDNMYFRRNSTLDFYTQLYSSEDIIDSMLRYGSLDKDKGPLNDYRDMLFVDGTPRTIWHGDTWDEDSINRHMDEPVALLPDKLHHVSPNVKIVILMRNPTSRLLSDYIFYNGHTAQNFHEKVVAAIQWWNTCVELHVQHQRVCAYGKAPPGLAELGFEECIRNKSWSYLMLNEHGHCCQSRNAWTENAADRLRVSMYDIYIKDWLKVFPRDNLLFIKFEDYAKAPVDYIERHVLPFLGLPSYRLSIRDMLLKQGISNESDHKVKILSETQKLLDQFYAQTKHNLADLLNDQRFLWNDLE